MQTQHVLKVEGHRGFRKFQNTAKGFHKAVELCLDGIETDLWVLKDDRVIIYHQHSPDGLMTLKCPKTGRISHLYMKDTEFDDLEGLLDLHTGEPVIDMDFFLDIVEKRPEMYLNLEIKDKRPEAFDKVAEVLQRRKVENKILFCSFEHEVKGFLDNAREKYPVLKSCSFGYLIFYMKDFEDVKHLKGGFRFSNFCLLGIFYLSKF